MILFLALVGIYLFAVLITAALSYRKLFHPQYRSMEYAREKGMERGEFDQSFLDLPWEEFEADSQNGYKIKGVILPGRGEEGGETSAPTAVFVHGITWTRLGMFKYAKSFIERGWNIVAFDLGGHGATGSQGKHSPSYGYYEKHDVAAACDEARRRFPNSRVLGLVGESLGAASALQYAGLPSAAPTFVVADCGFSSAVEELDARLSNLHLPYLVRKPVGALVSALAKAFRGFSLKESSSMKALLSTDIPILFIHGIDDRYVPFTMSIAMYNERIKSGRSRTHLLLVPGAKHAKSWNTDPTLWERTVFDFVEKYLDKGSLKG